MSFAKLRMDPGEEDHTQNFFVKEASCAIVIVIIIIIISLFLLLSSFLVADTQLYKRLRPSVGRSVGWLVGPLRSS